MAQFKQCKVCFRVFVAHSNAAKHCPICREEIRKRPTKKSRRIKTGKTLNEIMKDLEAYNKEHNTRLTYGKYVSMIEGEKIK